MRHDASTDAALDAPWTPPSSTGPRRAAFAFIFITLFLDVLALGVIIPVLPGLVLEFSAGDTARATIITGYFGASWAFMQFVFSPVLGALSDRFGRRPVILLSCFGLGLDYIFMALAPNLLVLFVGRMLSGMTAATYGTAGAYIADVTPPEKRAASFGMLGAAWGIGFICGPALGGALGNVDTRLPFWVAAGLTLANAMYGVFVLPESLPKDRRHSFSWGRANPFGALIRLGRHAGLLGLTGVNAIYWLAHHSLPSVFVLYTAYRYNWKPMDVGIMLALIGIGGAVVQAAVVRPVVKKFGEKRALFAGLIFGAAGFVWYGLAPTQEWFWASTPVFAMAGLISPSLMGLMSRRVGPRDQGMLQGVSGSVMGVTGMAGPLIFTQVFAMSIEGPGPHRWPGAPYLLAGAMLVFGLFAAILVTRDQAGATTPGASPANNPA